jgi:hypothetical protein
MLFSHLGDDRLVQVTRFVNEWCVPLGLATVPASQFHHNAFEGGLVDHMARVMDIALNVGTVMFPELEVDSIALCAGLHDLCKLGIFQDKRPCPRYVLNKDYDHNKPISKTNSLYVYNPDLPNLSMTILNAGISPVWLPLSLIEFKAIVYHDGMYVKENEEVWKTHNIEPLGLLIHYADMAALQYETKKEMSAKVGGWLGHVS